jgi:hypothetical protein
VLPLKIVNLLNTQVIEEDTGEVTHKFFEQFQIRQSERAKVRAAIGKVLEEFRVIEASKAKLISTEKDTFVRLEDCSKEVEGIFTAMVEELEPSFGSSRAVGMEVLLRKQLRHGGTEPMEIGLVKTDGGQYLLSKRTFDQHGFRKSLEETAFLASGSFSELNRWKCLEQIYQSATP